MIQRDEDEHRSVGEHGTFAGLSDLTSSYASDVYGSGRKEDSGRDQERNLGAKAMSAEVVSGSGSETEIYSESDLENSEADVVHLLTCFSNRSDQDDDFMKPSGLSVDGSEPEAALLAPSPGSVADCDDARDDSGDETEGEFEVGMVGLVSSLSNCSDLEDGMDVGDLQPGPSADSGSDVVHLVPSPSDASEQDDDGSGGNTSARHAQVAPKLNAYMNAYINACNAPAAKAVMPIKKPIQANYWEARRPSNTFKPIAEPVLAASESGEDSSVPSEPSFAPAYNHLLPRSPTPGTPSLTTISSTSPTASITDADPRGAKHSTQEKTKYSIEGRREELMPSQAVKGRSPTTMGATIRPIIGNDGDRSPDPSLTPKHTNYSFQASTRRSPTMDELLSNSPSRSNLKMVVSFPMDHDPYQDDYILDSIVYDLDNPVEDQLLKLSPQRIRHKPPSPLGMTPPRPPPRPPAKPLKQQEQQQPTPQPQAQSSAKKTTESSTKSQTTKYFPSVEAMPSSSLPISSRFDSPHNDPSPISPPPLHVEQLPHLQRILSQLSSLENDESFHPQPQPAPPFTLSTTMHSAPSYTYSKSSDNSTDSSGQRLTISPPSASLEPQPSTMTNDVSDDRLSPEKSSQTYVDKHFKASHPSTSKPDYVNSPRPSAGSHARKNPASNHHRSITLGSESSLEDQYGGYSLSKVVSYEDSTVASGSPSSRRNGASLSHSSKKNDAPTIHGDENDASHSDEMKIITRQHDATFFDLSPSTSSKHTHFERMESIASTPSVSSVSSLEEEELDRLASELSIPRRKSRRDKDIFRSSDNENMNTSAKSETKSRPAVSGGISEQSQAQTLRSDNDTSLTGQQQSDPHDKVDLEAGPIPQSHSSDNPARSKDTSGGSHYHNQGFSAPSIAQSSQETSSIQLTSLMAIFQPADWNWMAILYLSIFSIFGVTTRAFVGRLFGGDCDSSSPPHDWLYHLSQHICVTATGKTSQRGGALFVDLPANMLGSLIMGIMTGLSSDWPPIPWLSHDHPLQNEKGFHIGIKTALCGSITTFSSWNSQMVLMMDGTANSSLGPQVIPALFGYVLGLQASVICFRVGRQLSAWFHYWKNPHVFDLEMNLSCNETPMRQDGEQRSNQNQSLPSMEEDVACFRRFLWNERNTPIILIVTTLTLFFLGDVYWGIYYYRQLWIACLVSPLGTITRWKLSNFNGRWNQCPWIPIGTFGANFFGSVVSILMSAISIRYQHSSHFWGRPILSGISLGFAGSLSTVSTFVKEIVDMGDKNPHYDKKSFLYSQGTIVACCLVSLLIYCPIVRS